MKSTGYALLFFGIFLDTIAFFMLIFGVIGVGARNNANGVNPGLLIITVSLFLIGVFCIIKGISKLKQAHSTAAQEAADADTDGEPTENYPKNSPVTRELDGTPYTWVYNPPTTGKNARPSKLTISTPMEIYGEFEIVPESGYDRFAKKWGLASEIETLDETFDERCFVRSDTVEFTQAYLENPANRAIIADLHRLGFKSVIMLGGQIRAEWTGFNPEDDSTPELTEEVGARLILLARKLPPDLPEADMGPARRRRVAQTILWLTLIGFGITIISLLVYPPLRASELLLRAAVVLLGVFPGSLLLAAMMLKGTSRSHYAWRDWAIAACFLLPMGCVGSVALFNGAADTSDPVPHNTLIVNKYSKRNKNSTNYYIECRSWRDPNDIEKFQIPASDYNRVVINQTHAEIVTKSGALGMEWINSKKVLTGAPRPRKNK
jgi:hypothetical protein